MIFEFLLGLVPVTSRSSFARFMFVQGISWSADMWVCKKCGRSMMSIEVCVSGVMLIVGNTIVESKQQCQGMVSNRNCANIVKKLM